MHRGWVLQDTGLRLYLLLLVCITHIHPHHPGVSITNLLVRHLPRWAAYLILDQEPCKGLEGRHQWVDIHLTMHVSYDDHLLPLECRGTKPEVQ